MGCLVSVLNFLFLLWVVNLAWRFLIAPLILGEAAAPRKPLGRERYLRLLMPLLAKIAKADGRVSEREIDRVEAIFRSLGLSDEERRFAARVFSESKDSPGLFDAAAHELARAVGNFELRVVTFQYLVVVAAADGTVSDAERAMLARAAEIFGIPAPLAAQLFAQLAGGGPRTGGGRAAPRREAHSRAEDLALLGLPPSAGEAEIKKAYRQKVKELHPDRLQAQGLPQAMLRQASERMAAITAAYARLMGKA